MFTEEFKIRFYETDALRHVNNTVVPQWFETAREPVFKVFNPSLQLDNWPLIVAGFSVDFLAQIHYGKNVTVHTGIERIGNSSFVVLQYAYQDGIKVAKGSTTLVNFDYTTQRSSPISDDIKATLSQWLVETHS